MKTSRIRAVFAAAALAVVALVAVPVAANAVDTYPPAPAESYSGQTVVVPGGTTTITFSASLFTPGETVTFFLTGENAAGATLASFRTVVNNSPSINKVAGASGTPVAVTLPTNASGSYSLNGTSPSAGTVSVAISVGSAGAGGAAAAGGAGTGLATTGAAGDQLLWAWVAGGALAFVGGGVLVATAVRKQRKLAA